MGPFVVANYWAWMSMTCPPMVGSPGGSIGGLEADMGMAGWGGPPCINIAECWGCPGM